MKKILCLLFIPFILSSCKSDFGLIDDGDFKTNDQIGSFSKAADNLPIQIVDNFIWGLNGHPLRQEAYKDSNIDKQINLLSEHQTSYYRIDVYPDLLGSIDNYDKFYELQIKATQNKITILPVIILSNLDYELNKPSSAMTEDMAFLEGKAIGEGFANKYHDFIYYEVGNEIDDKILVPGTPGDDIAQYNASKFKIAAAYFKGVITGIKSKNTNAKIIINSSGWMHYRFFELLNNANVNYDIIGYHWYSEMGDLLNSNYNNVNIIDKLSAYDKDIWLTEVNRRNGSSGTNGEEDQRNKIENYINELDGQSRIKAFFVYELYDQPALISQYPNEAYYGIVKWNNNYESFTYKPVSSILKFKIEESMYGYEDYIKSLYLDINLREADADGLVFWSLKFKEERSKINIIKNILYGEGSSAFVKEQYRTLLDRIRPEDDPDGIAYLEGKMRNGVQRENIIMEICLSNEFWSRSGSTNEGFVNRLYTKLLNRLPDSNYWIDRLNNNTATKNILVTEMLRSQEYLQNYIRSQYIKLHNREVEPDALSLWYNAMVNGLNQQGLINEILLSKEYWYKSLRKGYETRNPSYPFFR